MFWILEITMSDRRRPENTCDYPLWHCGTGILFGSNNIIMMWMFGVDVLGETSTAPTTSSGLDSDRKKTILHTRAHIIYQCNPRCPTYTTEHTYTHTQKFA